jgi:hypothetical protein
MVLSPDTYAKLLYKLSERYVLPFSFVSELRDFFWSEQAQ